MKHAVESVVRETAEFSSPRKFTSFIFVRSKTDKDATIRLQSDPIIHGLRFKDHIQAIDVRPGELEKVPEGSCLLFHYDDAAAIAAIGAASRPTGKTSAICLGSDIYNFVEYVNVHEITDLYIMPTDLHRQILSSQVYKPVYCLPECVDPITVSAVCRPGDGFPIRQSTHAFWFGYSESFYKAMSSLVPIIEGGVNSGRILSFKLILDESSFENRFGIPTIPYDNISFSRDASAFDYCILSHFSLDLSLNSYIKSPNKLITALMIGAIPIASNTPNYRSVLSEFGLERFLFDSASDLSGIINNLDPILDSETIRKSGIVEALKERYSESSIADQFLSICSNFGETPHLSRMVITPSVVPVEVLRGEAKLGFRDHLIDLFPSLLRGLQKRLVLR